MTIKELMECLREYDENKEVLGISRGYRNAIAMEFGEMNTSEDGKIYFEMYDSGYAPEDLS